MIARMARLARIVIPDVPHHGTQRGNRRLPIFFSDKDRRAYLAPIAVACAARGVVCLGWCLMDNHVHMILIPRDADGLRAALGEAHRQYARRINFREGWRGCLFQGRFASYPMDDADDVDDVAAIEARLRTGRPLADPEWITAAEAAINRKLGPQRRGPKPKYGRAGDGN
jgi:putative transposase